MTKPEGKERTGYNKKLLNTQDIKVRALLRTHFEEFELTYEQFTWLSGRLKIKAGKYKRVCTFYSKDERHKRYQIKKV